MNIDSPQFVRRRIVYSNNNAHDPQNPRTYQLGSERALLSKHVVDSLNIHDKDMDILQRFRKDALELKRRNFELKKKKAIDEIQQKINSTNHINNQSTTKIVQFPKLPSIQLRTYQQPNYKSLRPRSINQYEGNSNTIIKQSQSLIKKLNDKLEHKNKKLQKKNEKLKKSQKIIEQMAKKVNQLKKEKQLAVKMEELQLHKINLYIEQINYKVAQNRAIFRQEINKLKSEIGLIPSSKNIQNNKERRSNLSIGYSSITNNKNRSTASQKLINSPSRLQQLNPSIIKYNIPLQRGSSQTTHHNSRQKQIQNSLSILKMKRNSLSRITQTINPQSD